MPIKRIQPISRAFGADFQIDVDANVAEAALTSGHDAEALSLARDVMQRASRRPETKATVIPMRIIAAAALAVRNDEKGAREMLEAIGGQKPSSTVWRYDGTKHYLRSAPVSSEMRRVLLEQIDRAALGR